RMGHRETDSADEQRRSANHTRLALSGASPARASGMDQGAGRPDCDRPRCQVLRVDGRRPQATRPRGRELGSALWGDSPDMPRIIDRLRLRARSLFKGAAADDSLRRELHTHLAEQIDEYLAAGMKPEAARARAMRDLGPIAVIEEKCRDMRRVAFVSNVVQDLRYTFRTLTRQPLLVLAATVSIAFGVGANTTIFPLPSDPLFSPP